MQIVVAVAGKGKRLIFPEGVEPALSDLASLCMAPDPIERPRMDAVVRVLHHWEQSL